MYDVYTYTCPSPSPSPIKLNRNCLTIGLLLCSWTICHCLQHKKPAPTSIPSTCTVSIFSRSQFLQIDLDSRGVSAFRISKMWQNRWKNLMETCENHIYKKFQNSLAPIRQIDEPIAHHTTSAGTLASTAKNHVEPCAYQHRSISKVILI